MILAKRCSSSLATPAATAAEVAEFMSVWVAAAWAVAVGAAEVNVAVVVRVEVAGAAPRAVQAMPRIISHNSPSSRLPRPQK
jgi:hypothetical protein